VIPDELMTKVGDHLSVHRAFGAPVERDGVTVIPVAVAIVLLLARTLSRAVRRRA
jgi:hypothetical protein